VSSYLDSTPRTRPAELFEDWPTSKENLGATVRACLDGNGTCEVPDLGTRRSRENEYKKEGKDESERARTPNWSSHSSLYGA
jgi:hypothetical protein